MKILCFDVGGMSIKYSIISNTTDTIKVNSIPTRVSENDNYILEDILKVIEENIKLDKIDAIGISTAGVVDNVKGEIVFAGPTIPNYKGTKFKETIEEKFNIPCFVENDVNAAAYGEYKYSKYKGVVFCLTIGTGVGGSIIIDDEIYNGNSMTAGEIGYMPFKNGYFQDYASATFILKEAQKRLNKKLNGKEIFENAKKNNIICLEIVNELVDNLTTGLLNIIYILNPKTIIVGGGITAQGDYLEDKIIKSLNKKLINAKFKTEVKLAKLQNSAGLYGMFYLTGKE